MIDLQRAFASVCAVASEFEVIHNFLDDSYLVYLQGVRNSHGHLIHAIGRVPRMDTLKNPRQISKAIEAADDELITELIDSAQALAPMLP